MPSYQPLVYEYRGELLDLVHMGYIAVVDEHSNVLYHVGDPDEMVFYRSAAKPLQALPVIARGLDRAYGITEEESVIFAGSHTGDDFHLAALQSIHKKAQLGEELLVMNPALPQGKHDPALAPRKFYHNCSGKHTAAMLLQRALGGDVRDYWKADSPAQRETRRTVAALSEFPVERVVDGIDGCGVPVFAVGMKHIAIAFKNLACPDRIADPALADAAARFMPRIHQYPLMMRGREFLCARINEDAAIVAKGGANAVYGIGLKDRRMGIAIKLADGVERMWPLVIAHVLRFLGHENEATFQMLDVLCPETIVNDNQTPCGRRACVFSLGKG
ncbi:MAG: asparaginase [Christensenellales bacterium]|jgi:L-asparaginase II